METEVVKKLIKLGSVVSWTRYADDCVAIIKIGSYDSVLKAINFWDQDTTFTGELMTENKINYLSCTIFIENGQIEFKTFRKANLDTLMSNYKQSVMSKRYLCNNITTALNHSENSCSNEDLFHADLVNLKEILIRNGYPEHIIDQKFFNFLCEPERPEKPEISFTLCISYTSPQVEVYARELVNRMKTFTPDFNVRFSFKSIKMKSLYIKNSKPFICKLDTCNVIYQFQCTCNKSYVGRTKRVLRIRAEEHRTFSRAKKTYYHIHRCPVYVKKLLEYEKIHIPPKSGAHFKTKVRDKFFMDHFKILQKNFKTYADLCRAEAFFIRMHRPSLNDQKDHKTFALF